MVAQFNPVGLLVKFVGQGHRWTFKVKEGKYFFSVGNDSEAGKTRYGNVEEKHIWFGK